MNNLYEVLHSKEEMLCQLLREAEALRLLIGLLDKDDSADSSPSDPTSAQPAVYLLTNSGRLEAVVQGAQRLHFAGQMRMPMEIMEVGNEFHIFVQSSRTSPAVAEEAAA
jgi:hypothetical protein